MVSAVCTLFEGNYQYGLAALANSLFYHGFRGLLWAGYRGMLPKWVSSPDSTDGYVQFRVAPDFAINFVEVNTSFHFSNFKPHFILSLLEQHCNNVDALYYFDPDIVILKNWSFFEEWVSYGVALCEDVNSPLPDSHPRRMAWRRLYMDHGFEFVRETSTYVNGGFVGLKLSEKLFIQNWLRILNIASDYVDGLEQVSFGVKPKMKSSQSFLFDKEDQDSLNVSVMISPCCISLIGKEGMQIKLGDSMMSHAFGGSKPWQKNYTLSALMGKRPTWSDRNYWLYTQRPIKTYSFAELALKKLDLFGGKLIGKFIK